MIFTSHHLPQDVSEPTNNKRFHAIFARRKIDFWKLENPRVRVYASKNKFLVKTTPKKIMTYSIFFSWGEGGIQFGGCIEKHSTTRDCFIFIFIGKMKLAIVLMLAFCLFLQTHARMIEDEIPSSNEVSEKQNDPLYLPCVWDFCAPPFRRCCPGSKDRHAYCINGRCLRVRNNSG